MANKLSNLQIGTLKTTGNRKPRAKGLPNLTVQTQQAVESQALITIPELQMIQRIAGSQPFLIGDIIPDIIFMLQYEGSKAFIDTLPQAENGDIQVQGVEPKPGSELLRILLDQTWDAFLPAIYPYGQLDARDLVNRIYNSGIQAMTVNIAAADPQNPASLIFRHSSQEIHIKTQEIEIDIIRNEPEVSERDDIQCACGSRRVRTVPVQIRRADEPPHIFAQCVACKIRWVFSSA